jgi:ammonium transporter, Amt family
LRVSGNARHLLLRAIAVGASVGFSFVGSLILLKVTDAPVDLGANAESEPIGLDISEHEEPSYAFDA